jgi:hypothetical protein
MHNGSSKAQGQQGHPTPGISGAPTRGLKMDGDEGWLMVGAGHPDPSLTRFSYVKTFNMRFSYKAGT